MPRTLPRSPRVAAALALARRPETLVAAAFAMAVVLLAAGAWTVWRSAVRHRVTADGMLRDHASYIASGIANSAQSEGWFAVRTLLRAWHESLGSGAHTSTELVVAKAERDAIGPGLVLLTPRRFFAGAANRWVTTAGRADPTDPVFTALARRFADSLPPIGYFRYLIVPTTSDTAIAFVASDTAAGVPRLYGFDEPLADFRDKVVAPHAMGLIRSFRRLADSAGNAARLDAMPPIALRVASPEGAVLYATPNPLASGWRATSRMTGSLAATVGLSLEPTAIPFLMPGGYPPDPAARVAAALALGLAVLGAAAALAWRTLALSRQREEFTSSVSHELRTPLTNIQLFAETLSLDRARTADERRTAIETITRETRRLVHMVENVLALSRVGRPALALVRGPERVERLVTDAVTSFDPLFRANDIATRITVQGPEIALIDGDAVRRILVNLLDNAVRYGPVGQTIAVRAIHRGDRLEVVVEDEGPGVPAADRDRVWRAFERGTNGTSGGTGIGLAVVRQLVTLHGGQARIEDGERGARVTVVLPLPVAAGAGS